MPAPKPPVAPGVKQPQIENARNKVRSVRLATWLCPPLGFVLLWLTRGIPVWRKLFASLFILLYTPIYLLLIVVILWKFFGLQYEFRGGLVPALTWRKTLPNY